MTLSSHFVFAPMTLSYLYCSASRGQNQVSPQTKNETKRYLLQKSSRTDPNHDRKLQKVADSQPRLSLKPPLHPRKSTERPRHGINFSFFEPLLALITSNVISDLL